MPQPYDEFIAAYNQSEQARLYGPITQDMLNANQFLAQLPLELIRLIPAGRLESFDSSILVQLDNNDLLNLIMHNPHVANSIPGYRLTKGVQRPDGSWSGGLSAPQLQSIVSRAGQMGIQGPGITEIGQTVGQVTGQPAPGAPPTPGATTETPSTTPTPGTVPPGIAPLGGDQTVPSLAREQWEAELANQPGNVYEWLFRSRGMEPPGGPRQIYPPGTAPATVSDMPGGDAGGSKVAGTMPDLSGGRTGGVFQQQSVSNPWTSAGSQIVNQPRPTFEQLRGQVQGVGGDIPPEVLNPILGLSTPSFTTQGGMPLLAAQTAARMSPAARALWDVTVNRTGGRAEDDRYQAQRLGRLGGNVPTVEYTGVSRTPGARR